MRLLLLGATGGTGLALTAQALERGHDVTVFVRAPDRVTARGDRLKVIVGDPRDVDQLARALAGQEAVVSALGSATRKPTSLQGESMQCILDAMRRTGVRRLLVTSSSLLFPDIGTVGRVFRFIFRHEMRDALVMEGLIRASDVDWTIVRPVRLTDGKPIGTYRVAPHAPPAGSITRADVARCMLDAVEARTHVRKVIGVSR